MSIALDYTTRIAPAALKANDVSDVCRYLSWLHRWGGATHPGVNPKIIQQPEFNELVGSGIGVTLNWEYDARDWLGGADAGQAHAVEAARQAQSLGYPQGRVIIGSADFDMTRAQWLGSCRAYALAWRDQLGKAGYMAGVYGPYDALSWCADDVGIRVFWQAGMSTAWSSGRNAKPWPGVHLRQRRHVTVGGVDADLNDILISNWGQHRKDPTMASEQLLNGWPTPTDENGKPDTRGVGIWTADVHGYVWHGGGAYVKNGDPNGPPTDLYLDVLLKLIRDEVRAIGQVTLSEADRSDIANKVVALLGPSPSAGQVATEIIRQLAR